MKVKSSATKPCSQETFTSVYGPQFPSTNFGLQPLPSTIYPPRYSFIACPCTHMNELKMTKRAFLVLHVNAKCLVQVKNVLPTFDVCHQYHMIPYPTFDWLMQVCTLHYVLLSLLEAFSVYSQYLARHYALPHWNKL